MRHRISVSFALVFVAVASFAFAPRRFHRLSLCSAYAVAKRSRLFESVENDVEQEDASSVLEVAILEAYPKAEIVTMELAEHRPLGCTVEESMDTENDPSIVFVSKVVAGGNAEKAGIKVGDVLIGITGLFGEIMPVFQSGVEKM
jgi:S1-C subfamily serine protease